MSKTVMTFELPNIPRIRAEIVEAIPDDWTSVNGQLETPDDLVRSDQVVRGTGYYLYRDDCPKIVGRGHTLADLSALLVRRLHPGFIRFDEAGRDTRQAMLPTLRSLAAMYIRMGYTGSLRFSKWLSDVENYPATCALFFHESDPANRHCITLEWRQNEDGSIMDIMPVINICSRIGLLKHSPISPQSA